MGSDRLQQQIQFILEIDRLKQVFRQTLLTDASRQENSAEHSWHIAVMAIVMAEYAPEHADMMQAVKMLLIHDLVEIDAGDTPCYDVQGNLDKAIREQQAADRLFGLLPTDQAIELRNLWEEFEAQTTATAKFATALDRLQPLLHHQQTQGENWQRFQVTRREVEQRVAPIQVGSPSLWAFTQQVLDDCVAAGYLQPPVG
ncbi:MAG: HD domain-containing protein [Elainella sp. Prado103]|jgi:putative hydrolase of HD superfamily|nr:HD domain-containing protein [Elainella sp. Prado103]